MRHSSIANKPKDTLNGCRGRPLRDHENIFSRKITQFELFNLEPRMGFRQPSWINKDKDTKMTSSTPPTRCTRPPPLPSLLLRVLTFDEHLFFRAHVHLPIYSTASPTRICKDVPSRLTSPDTSSRRRVKGMRRSCLSVVRRKFPQEIYNNN